MRLSDLIAGLKHLQQQHGDIPVLERRQVFYYDATELFPDCVEIDKRVIAVAGWHEPMDGKHHYHEERYAPTGAADLRTFNAFVL